MCFECLSNEEQKHSFVHCTPIVSKVSKNICVQYTHIFGTLVEQITIMQTFGNIQKLRNHVKRNDHQTGGVLCQDPCTFGTTLNGAEDTTSA